MKKNEIVDDLLHIKELEINELQSKKIQTLRQEVEERNQKIYELIQKNETFLLNDEYKNQSLSIKEFELNELLNKFNVLKETLHEKEEYIYEILRQKEKNENINKTELSLKDREIQKLKEKIDENFQEINFYKCQNNSLESLEDENIVQIEKMKNKLDQQIQEKEKIIDKLLDENKDFKSKNNKLEGLKMTKINENDKTEGKYKKLTDSLYKEINELKNQVLDFEAKMKIKKKRSRNKLEKLKDNYFLYLGDYEQRHLEQMKEMKENFDFTEFELQKLTLENEQLKSKIRFINDNKSYSTNESTKILEKKLLEMEEKNKKIQNEILNKDFEMKKLKEEIVFLQTQKENLEKKLHDNEKKENYYVESKDSLFDYEDNDFEGTGFILAKIKENLKNQKFFQIIEKKFNENEIIIHNCHELQNQIDYLKKENLSLGYEILKLHKKNLEIENRYKNEKDKMIEENYNFNLEKNKNPPIELKSQNNFVYESQKNFNSGSKKEKVFSNDMRKKNIFLKTKENINKTIPIKLPRYEDFEKIESMENK